MFMECTWRRSVLYLENSKSHIRVIVTCCYVIWMPDCSHCLLQYLCTVADAAQLHLQSVDVVCATSKDFPGPVAVVFPAAADRGVHDHTVQGQALSRLSQSNEWLDGLCKLSDLFLLKCRFLYCTLCSLGTGFSSNWKRRLYFCCKVRAFAISLEAMLKLFSPRTKWQGKELMETVPKQWGNKFLSRCKSEHGIVESSVSKSFAHYQYRQVDLSVARGSKNGINKKHCPWSVAKNWKYCYYLEKYDNYSVSVLLFVFECKQVCTLLSGRSPFNEQLTQLWIFPHRLWQWWGLSDIFHE